MKTKTHLYTTLAITVMAICILHAQKPFLYDYEEITKTTTSGLELKGSNISKLVWKTNATNSIDELYVGGTNTYAFEQGRLIKKVANTNTKLGTSTYYYNNGKLAKVVYLNEKNSETLKTIEFKKNTIIVYENGQSKPSIELTTDPKGNITQFKEKRSHAKRQYDNKGRIVFEEKKIFDFAGKKHLSTRTENFTYGTEEWYDQQVSKRTSNYETKGRSNNLGKNINYYDKDGNNVYHYFTAGEANETYAESSQYYKYDAKGNWIARATFTNSNQFPTTTLKYFEQRQITYSDGTITGYTDYDIDKLIRAKLKFPKFGNTYSFIRDLTKDTWTLKDPSGNNYVTERIIRLGYMGEDAPFMLDPDNNTLMALTNFKTAPDKTWVEAETISMGYNSFLYINAKKKDFLYINGKPYNKNNHHIVFVDQRKAIIYDDISNTSFYVSYHLDTPKKIYPVTPLPKSTHNAYWTHYVNKEGAKDFLFVENGKTIVPNPKTDIEENGNWYIKTNLGYYLVEAFKKAERGRPNVPKSITKAIYEKAYAKLQKESIKTVTTSKGYIYHKNDNDTFSLTAPSGASIINECIQLGFIDNDYYVYYPKGKDLVKLPNFKSNTTGAYNAEVVIKDQDHFLFTNGKRFVMYCEEKIQDLNALNMGSLTETIYVLSPLNSNRSYTINIPKNKVGISIIKQLEENRENTYWIKTKAADGGDSFLAYRNGGLIKMEDINYVNNETVIFKEGDRHYFISKMNTVKAYEFKKLVPIPKENYLKLKHSLKKVKDILNKTTSSVSKCAGKTQCLLSEAQKAYDNTINNGQSTENAYIAMSNVYVEAYNINPEYAFNMFMQMEGKHLTALLKVIPKDIHGYVRAKAKGVVDDHVKKHGEVKIKTVPYKPKN